MIVPRYDFRFIVRKHTMDDVWYSTEKVLQVRHQELNGGDQYEWTEWEDVLVEEEEETTKVFY